MPLPEQHLQWAQGFERDSQTAIAASIRNWGAVAAFYSAMHYVQAYFETKGLGIHNHLSRNSWVARDANLRSCHISYQRLFDWLGLPLPRDAGR